MCKQPVLAFYCSRPLIYEGPHIGFQFHEGNSEFNSEERNSDSNSNSNEGNSNSIPIPLDWVKPIPIPELDLELARKSNSGAELTPTLLNRIKKIDPPQGGFRGVLYVVRPRVCPSFRASRQHGSAGREAGRTAVSDDHAHYHA